MADFDEIQGKIEGFMKKLSNKKQKKKYEIVEELRKFIFTDPQPYLNLDQIDYLLVGDDAAEI